MKTPLAEILKKVTPLLPAVAQCDEIEGGGQEAFVNLNDGKTKVHVPIYIDGTGKFLGKKQHFMLVRYMAHSANVLPELVKVLDEINRQSTICADGTGNHINTKWLLAKTSEALKSAQQVEGV